MSLGSINCGFTAFNNVTSDKLPEGSKRPEGFEGSSKDVFVRDDRKEADADMQFAKMGRLFKNTHSQQSANSSQIQMNSEVVIEGDGISMFEGRNGYDRNFLGTELPLPTLGDSIKDKVAMRTDKPGECELTYTNYSVVMNKDRRQCFYTIANVDGATHHNIKRSGSWKLDGRIPTEYQLGDEAYARNDIDKGHMVRRLDTCWGKDAQRANHDTFSYCNATLQHADLNQQEWLQLEDHVLNSVVGNKEKYTVITGPIFSDNDPQFDNRGKMERPTQIPMKFFKTVVWADEKTGSLKSASFVLSQEDIINGDTDLFKAKGGRKGFDVGKFEIYQVPQSQLEKMTDLHFGNIGDISAQACRLTAANGYMPQGL